MTRKRKSTVLRKCEDLMETLWNDGYRQQVTRNNLRDYVFKHCGGFRTTVEDYLGKRAEYYRSRGREGVLKKPSRKGYLERFEFIEIVNQKILLLRHERVDRDYHRKQLQVDGADFSLTDSVAAEREKKGVETTEGDRDEREIQNEREKSSPAEISLTFPHLTSEEQAILSARPCEKQLLRIARAQRAVEARES